MITIRKEFHRDVEAREALLDRCFGDARFEKAAERLREGRLPAQGLAFTASDRGRVVATARLWNVSAGPSRPALLLGPIAVHCDYRCRGLGGELMRHALDTSKRLGHRTVMLVGDAPYYERFGFSAAATGGLWLPGPYDANRFLALELAPGALAGAGGLVSPTGRIEPKPALSALIARTAHNESARAA
ncbi:MAG: GNAT family N-acetyltransferase [Rhizobiales bacterium]|nr:GNAT family N-acetyltransferase [Hyphomicrobiales bacterium]